MEKFEGNADYGGIVQHSQQHEAPCVKGLVGIGHERFENGGSVLGRHPAKVYTGDRRSSMP